MTDTAPTVGMLVIYVTEMERSIRFYRDGLGFALQNESPAWSELDAGGITLALHITENPGEEHGFMSAGRADLQVTVANLDATRERLLSHGLDVNEPMLMEDINLRVVQVRDPDGLDITLSAAAG